MGNIPVSLESGKWINQGNHGKGPQNEEWDREIISGHTIVPLSGAQPQATSDPNTEQGQKRQKGGIFQRKLICGTLTHLMLWIKLVWVQEDADRVPWKRNWISKYTEIAAKSRSAPETKLELETVWDNIALCSWLLPGRGFQALLPFPLNVLL